MFDSVVLLTGPGERSILSTRLAAFRPDLKIIAAGSRADLLALDAATLAASRLIAFTTSVIVPPEVLAGLGHGAYNFHPGPPEYPGLSPAQFAVYDGARSFGATVHRMAAEIDAGPIIAVSRFDVPFGATLTDLETGAFQKLARLFWDLSSLLAIDGSPLPELAIEWGRQRSTRISTAAMCAIPTDIDPSELRRRVAAFAKSPYGLSPTVTIHGYRFRLELDEEADDAAMARTENTAVPSAA
jgi:methionyl-tRNA formyltransferase